MGSFWTSLISKCSMMPKWHHPDISSRDVRESITNKQKLKVYASSRPWPCWIRLIRYWPCIVYKRLVLINNTVTPSMVLKFTFFSFFLINIRCFEYVYLCIYLCVGVGVGVCLCMVGLGEITVWTLKRNY